MSREQIVLVILAVSTAISLLYVIVALFRRSSRRVIIGLTMLVCPAVGPFYYFGSRLVDQFGKKQHEMQIEDIGFSKKKWGRVLRPDFEEEIQLVPLEESFLVAQDKEKRKNLLRELKKDEVRNYTALVKALDNDDLETAHYAASAISAAKTDFENNLRALDTEYNRAGGRQDLELVRAYADHVLMFLRSGILGAAEGRKYSYLLLNLLTDAELPPDFLTIPDYTAIVEEALRLGLYERAEEWADRAFGREESEATYLLRLRVFFAASRPDKFLPVMEDLKRSGIPISDAGLDLIRFFRGGQGRAGA